LTMTWSKNAWPFKRAAAVRCAPSSSVMLLMCTFSCCSGYCVC
jgi:hypothetical protein